MKDAVVRRALDLGFDLCRVTTAHPPASGPHFTRWLEANRHGGMDYMVRTAPRRLDPRLVLENLRSIVVLAASYHLPSATPSPPIASDSSPNHSAPPAALPPALSDPSGVVARYACHADYHEALAPRLAQLVTFIDGLAGPGTRSLAYVDTGPLLERDLAQRAGLGFIGKHTNLIARSLGNWFLLAEILTTAEIQPDPPESNRCGSCQRCLHACPTQAILAPFQLDARRCISYLTIELKGSIPVELRPAIGNRIFGCDDCLAACPWNRFAREGRILRESRRTDLAHPNLRDLLHLDHATFKSRFAGTPILRAKRRGLLRNVCVALGNVGSPADLPALQRAASDPEPLVAEHADWAIHQITQRNSSACSSSISPCSPQ